MNWLVFFITLCSLAWDRPVHSVESQIDNYHGISVADPFRYLEDSHSLETKEWITAENNFTSKYLEQVPQRETIRQKLESLWNFEKYQYLNKLGNQYLLSMGDGLQNQPVIYTLNDLGSKPEVLVDPNTLSTDGTVSVTLSVPSMDGEWLAYCVAHSGSDWVEIRIRNVKTKEDLNERLHRVKFTNIAWLSDGKGFYYCRYDEPKEGKEYSESLGKQKIYFHELGTKQENDQFIYEYPQDGPIVLSPNIDSEDKYLIITVFKNFDSCSVFYQKLGDASAPVIELFSDNDGDFIYIGNQESNFWFLTNQNAPFKKLITINLETKVAVDLIPEREYVLKNVSLTCGKFIASYLKDASTQLEVYHLDGTFEKIITLPSIGTAHVFSRFSSNEELFFSFSSFTHPPSIYGYHLSTGKTRSLFQPKLQFSPEDYETKQVFYHSRDGTKIPLTLSYKKGTSLNQVQPVYLYGYGGFGVSIEPFFSVENLAWMEMGGVFALANLRGGGEYGKDWHDSGKLSKKQNVFDDFICAAEWLISQNLTTPSRLAIGGRSNGGLLIGACLNQRPDLFGAAFVMVGVLDMLRFHLFTAGKFWVSEYGNVEDPEQFSALYRYSPLHNIQRQDYPPTFILTADHDDRVVPAHSYKYAATLKKAQTASHPILLRVDSSAGHGQDKPVSKRIDEATDKLAFLFSLNFFPTEKDK